MGRPPLPLGTAGKIKAYPCGRSKFRARCKYRDWNGKIFRVERYGSTRPKAESRLKEAIRDWVTPAAIPGDVSRDTRFSEVALLWLKEMEGDAEREERSWGTVDTYRNRLEKIVLPAVGELRMREIAAAVPVLDALCRRVRDQSSASSARTVRAVLSGVCGLAVRYGALESNPVRDVSRIETKKAKKKPTQARALSVDEVIELLRKLDADGKAIEDDLPDLARFFLATGERTGEALCAHWPDFDAKNKVIYMEGNVIRAKGRGLIINRGKTENAKRPIPLPDWCVQMLIDRQAKAKDPDALIFPTSVGTIREPTNVRNRAWRPFTERAGYEWVTFKTLRKTVATLLDEQGLTARQIADILGHSRPSMTQDVYMGRRVTSRVGAEKLDQVLGEAIS